jgi:hypothetical protein
METAPKPSTDHAVDRLIDGVARAGGQHIRLHRPPPAFALDGDEHGGRKKGAANTLAAQKSIRTDDAC